METKEKFFCVSRVTRRGRKDGAKYVPIELHSLEDALKNSGLEEFFNAKAKTS